MTDRVVTDEELLIADPIALRLVRLEDCTETYLGWLQDPDVNRYLETRWYPQSLDAIRAFVTTMRADPDSYLFAILERRSGRHVGNIKLGPVNRHHQYADVSYFVGDRTMWGRGFATLAIREVTRIGFDRLALSRVQAGVYEQNTGSIRALEKVGYRLEGRFRSQLVAGSGRQDHLYFGMLREEFAGGPR